MCCSFYGGEGGKSNFDFSRPILPYVNPPWETCECATRKNHVEKRTEWSPWMECHRTNVSIQQSADYCVCRMSCKPLFASEKRCEWQSQPWNRVFHVLHVRLMFFKKLLWDGVCCSVFKKSGAIDASSRSNIRWDEHVYRRTLWCLNVKDWSCQTVCFAEPCMYNFRWCLVRPIPEPLLPY